MALTLSGTNGVVGAGFTVDASGVSVTAGVGTFSSVQGSASSLTQIPAANIVGVCTAGLGNASGAFGQGISNIDQWYVSSNFTGTADPVSSNLARYTTAGSYIGDGMSVSSGIWTFPTTGFWQIEFQAVNTRVEAGRQSKYQYIRILGTTDNSSYNMLSEGHSTYYDNYDASYRYSGNYCSVVFDVTNTSTHKVKFTTIVQDNDSQGVRWDSPNMRMSFTKLADT